MIPLNYHHLYYFRTIAKAGSLAKASELLLLAQPTLSLQLMQLEKALGQRLFERRKQRLILTDQGRFVLGYAERIFEAGAELQDALKDGPRAGRVKMDIGIMNGTPRSLSHLLLESLFELAPHAHVTVKEGPIDALLIDLREHRLDGILSDISIRAQDQETFDNQLVARIPILFAASPRLARRYPCVPQDLAQAPLILPSSPSRLYQEILDRLAEWKVKPNIIADIQDIELARRTAVSGHGIVPLNALTLSVSLPRKALIPLKTTRPLNLFESVYFVTRKKTWPNPVTDQLPITMAKRYSQLFRRNSPFKTLKGVLLAVVVMGVGSTGMARADGKACEPDVQKFCSETKKGEGQVMSCLKAHGPDLSDPCKAEIRAQRKQIHEKMKQLNEVCGADRQKFCGDVKPGAGRIKNCMADHESELSGACRAVVDQKSSETPS
jgi:LysR family transcriptional activator of nhaA